MQYETSVLTAMTVDSPREIRVLDTTSPKFLSSYNNLLFNNSLKIETIVYAFPLPYRVPCYVPCLVRRQEGKCRDRGKGHSVYPRLRHAWSLLLTAHWEYALNIPSHSASTVM